MKKNKLALLLATGLLLMVATASFALPLNTYKTVDNASPQDFVDGMATKGVRGAANLLTGWLEFPKQIYVTGEQDGWVRGTFIGPFKGIGMTVVRTVSGAGELLTFFVSYPGYFDPWFEPSYVWEHE